MYATSFRQLLRFLLYFLFLRSFVTGEEDRIDRLDIIIKEEKKFPWESIRLPQTLFPLNYNIRLDTDLKLFYVKGTVGITVKCAKQTANIILHLRDTNVTNTAVFEKRKQDVDVSDDVRDEELIKRLKKGQQDRELNVVGTMSDKTLEMFLIKVNEELIPGQTYVIHIEFNYLLKDTPYGFYRSSYTAQNGKKRYRAVSVFEPIFARRAFPCFDEPAMKATFTVTIIREGQYNALSNMPKYKTVKIGEDLYADHFKESVKMSTYLVAFVVSDFKSIETNTSSGIKVRLWAPPSQISQGSYALDIAAKTLSNYEKFFKIPFPLPKEGLVAYPADLLGGGLENWGLVAVVTSALLFDPDVSTDSAEEIVSRTVTHELAHQWFGNLVTVKWWNDIWLTEGFATYMEDIGLSFIEPTWSMMDQFVHDKLYSAFNYDQSSFSHPVSVALQDPKNVADILDTLSYAKGASVIRMMGNFLGSEGFTTGLEYYLNKFAFGNADSFDLFECLAEQTGINVKKVMDTWIKQMGLPVVTITRVDQEKARADQKLFLILPGAKPNQSSPFDYTWNIPLTYITQKNKDAVNVWMNRGPASLNWVSSDGWIKANVDQIGYYRVNYEAENWKALSRQLKTDHKALSAVDRSGLIDDAFHLTRGNLLAQSIPLDLTEYIIHETDYVPLKTFIQNMNYIGSNLSQRKSYGLFKSYMLKQLDPAIRRLGLEDKGSHLEKLLRPSILSTACDCSDQEVIFEVKKMFQPAMEGQYIASNLLPLVYSIGVREGGVKEWDQVYDKYKSTNIASEKKILLSALTYTRNRQMIERILDYSLDDDKIRSQDTITVISQLATNSKAWQMTWNFVRHNWKILYKRYESDVALSSLITSLMASCNTETQLREFTEFFKAYPSAANSYRQVQMGMEKIRANIMWLSEHGDEVTAWLARHI